MFELYERTKIPFIVKSTLKARWDAVETRFYPIFSIPTPSVTVDDNRTREAIMID